MALSIKPLSDRIMVEAAPAEEVSSGGIILPDFAHGVSIDQSGAIRDGVQKVGLEQISFGFVTLQ